MSSESSLRTIRRAARPDRVALVGILALAAVLRFFQLGHDSLWVDEGFSVRIAKIGGTGLLDEAVSADPNPPLYYAVLHLWMDAFGDSEAALRSLSAVVGVALVFVVFKLGERLAGARVGVTAALFAAVSEFLVHYSQEARVYSLLGFLAAASYLFFVDLLDDLRTSSVVGYVLATTALVYAHTYGLFVLAAQIAFVAGSLAFRRDWVRAPDLRPLGAILATPVLLGIPWFVFFAGHVRAEVEGTGKARLNWLAAPSLGDLPGTLSGYAGSRWALVVVALAVGASAYAALRRGADALARRVLDDRRVAMLVIWIAIPTVVPFLLSLTVTPIYQFKYTIPAAVACYLLLALALQGLGVRAGLVAAGVVGLAFLGTTARYYGDRTEQWREATAFVARQASSGDVLVFDSNVGQDAFDYYWRRSDVEEIVGSRREGRAGVDLAAVRTAAGARTVWLVISHSRDPDGRIPVLLERSHHFGSDRDFLGIRISRFD